MVCGTSEVDGVVSSGLGEPACFCISARWFHEHTMKSTFLQTKETDGLCTAYFVTTSRMRPYSSEELRKAESRVGVL